MQAAAGPSSQRRRTSGGGAGGGSGSSGSRATMNDLPDALLSHIFALTGNASTVGRGSAHRS